MKLEQILVVAFGTWLLWPRKAKAATYSGGFVLQDYGHDPALFFDASELTASNVAHEYGIAEQFNPPASIMDNARKLGQWVLDPVRNFLGAPVRVNNWWRSPALNEKLIALYNAGAPGIGKPAKNSKHLTAEAADIDYIVNGTQRNDLLIAAILHTGVPFDRMILEKGTRTNPDWVHIEFDASKGPAAQRGIIKVLPNGATGYDITRAEAENIFL